MTLPRRRSVEVVPLVVAHERENSFSTPHKTERNMSIPRLSSKQWIALVLGAFFALLLFSQAIAPKAATWVISPRPPVHPPQEVAANPKSDILLDISQVVVGSPTPHFRGQHPTSFFPTTEHRNVMFLTDNLRNDTRYLTSWISSGFSEFDHSLASICT